MIPEEHKNARKKAMQLLEHMDRTEKGLSDRLRQAGFSYEAVENAIKFVKSYGYLNDFRYAENYISYRIHSKSKQKIFMELQQKGIDRETISQAWSEVEEFEEPCEKEMIRSIIEKKYGTQVELDEKALRRLYGYLMRRGFKMSDIKSVFEEMDIFS